MLYVDTVDYWCLNKNNIPGYDLPNLKYLFADDIIAMLQAIGEDKLCSDITNLYQIYDSFSDSYISHRKDYIITKFKEFHYIHGRAPYHRDLHFGKGTYSYIALRNMGFHTKLSKLH